MGVADRRSGRTDVYPTLSSSPTMSWVVCLYMSTLSVVLADVNIDLSTAELDTETGNYCVLQKVCIVNPPSSLTESGCAPSFPPGCNCDPQASPEDSTCSPSQTCVGCRCLDQGCDCDPNAENPDSFCAPDLRCVACKCKGCPESSKNKLGQGSDKVLNPPLVFVIDTTKSVKPDKDSIFNLTNKVTERIMKDGINIPRYQLVTFNDFGPEINLNVKLELDTDDVIAFAQATRSLKFESYNGGRDSKERLAQGLLVALQNASEKSLVVVFTDNGSKDLMLETEIVRLRKAKEIEVFIVLTPAYEGHFNGKSLPAYGRWGKVFLINEVGADVFLRKVEQFEEENCV